MLKIPIISLVNFIFSDYKDHKDLSVLLEEEYQIYELSLFLSWFFNELPTLVYFLWDMTWRLFII